MMECSFWQDRHAVLGCASGKEITLVASQNMDHEGLFTWECQECTFLNAADRTHCDMCYLRRGVPSRAAWVCRACCACCPSNETFCSRCGAWRDRTPSECLRQRQRDSPPKYGAGTAADLDFWHDPRRQEDNFDIACPVLDDIKEDRDLVERDSPWRCVSCDSSSDSDDVLSVFSCQYCSDGKSPEPMGQEPQWTSAVDKISNCRQEISNTEELTMPQALPLISSHQNSRAVEKQEEFELINYEDIKDFPLALIRDVSTRKRKGLRRRSLALLDPKEQNIDEPCPAFKDKTRIRFPDAECRLVLLGKTGSGKSATANTIAGFRRFETGRGFRSTTKQCQRINQLRFGVHVEVVDTPGLFDTDVDNATVVKEIIKCIGVVSPGPHALVLVLRAGIKFTEEEIKTLEILRAIFGKELLKYLVLVFTHGDRLGASEDQWDKEVIADMLDDAPSKLKELVKEANNRYVVFNNKGTPQQKEQHVKELLLSVRQVVQYNGSRPFTNSFLETAEKVIQERETTLALQLRETSQSKKDRRRNTSRTPREKRLTRDLVREELVKESPVLQCIRKVLQPAIKVLSGNAEPCRAKGCSIM